jgi:hypothetical protein
LATRATFFGADFFATFLDDFFFPAVTCFLDLFAMRIPRPSIESRGRCTAVRLEVNAHQVG